jgi:hypothetical protein
VWRRPVIGRRHELLMRLLFRLGLACLIRLLLLLDCIQPLVLLDLLAFEMVELLLVGFEDLRDIVEKVNTGLQVLLVLPQALEKIKDLVTHLLTGRLLLLWLLMRLHGLRLHRLLLISLVVRMLLSLPVLRWKTILERVLLREAVERRMRSILGLLRVV